MGNSHRGEVGATGPAPLSSGNSRAYDGTGKVEVKVQGQMAVRNTYLHVLFTHWTSNVRHLSPPPFPSLPPSLSSSPSPSRSDSQLGRNLS